MDHTKVLAEFAPPKAKFDLIKIPLPAAIKTAADERAFMAGTRGGRAEFPARYRDIRDDWLTIHDPTPSDLQYLLDQYHEMEILELEIAIDFALKDGSNDLERLEELHRMLVRTLHPLRHKRFRLRRARQCPTRRHCYDPSDRKIKPDTLNSGANGHTAYWQDRQGYVQLKAYVKMLDNGEGLDQHVVRVEVTLYRGGCQGANVHRIGLLPTFIDGMRSDLSRMFCVAKGIRPKIKRTRATRPDRVQAAQQAAEKEARRVQRAWDRNGASWAAKNDYEVIPDANMNRKMGDAINELRRQMRGLKLPSKVGNPAEWIAEQTSMYVGFSECAEHGCIEACSSSTPLSPSTPSPPPTVGVGFDQDIASKDENNSQLNTHSQSTTLQHIVSGDTTPDHTGRDHIIPGQDEGGGDGVGVKATKMGKGDVVESETEEHKEMVTNRPSSSDLPTSPYTLSTTPPKGG